MQKLSCKASQRSSRTSSLWDQARHSQGSRPSLMPFCLLCFSYPRAIKPCPFPFVTVSFPSSHPLSSYLNQGHHNFLVNFTCYTWHSVDFLITNLLNCSSSWMELSHPSCCEYVAMRLTWRKQCFKKTGLACSSWWIRGRIKETERWSERLLK